MTSTFFRRLFDPDSSALTYLIAECGNQAGAAGEAAIIDPLKSQATLVMALLAEQGLRLRYVLRTHVHSPDHLDCGRLCRRTGARYIVGSGVSAHVQGERVADGEALPLGDTAIRVIATPGHAPGGVSYLWRDRLLCGDTLRINGCEHATAETDAGALYDSVTRTLFTLPDDTLIYPGHEYGHRTVSTVLEERLHNRAFAGMSREQFITRLRQAPATGPSFTSNTLSLGSGNW